MADFFSVQDISLCLGGRQILDHVSFSVDTPGRVIGLLGPNGGGKTTLLRAICGELPHDGHVFLEGAELAGLRSKELARRVSYIPQQSGISISMSAIDVVLMGFYPKLKLLSQPSADMRAAALRALEQVGMAGLADRDYLTLSGGEKQLVILARTLVEDTKLLLFDEPDSSLDLGNKYRMASLFQDLLLQALKNQQQFLRQVPCLVQLCLWMFCHFLQSLHYLSLQEQVLMMPLPSGLCLLFLWLT